MNISNKTIAGPLKLTESASLVSVPLSASGSSLDENDFFGYWQKQNVARTIPHIFKEMVDRGYIANMASIKNPEVKRRAMWFSDSDVFKGLEAALWSSQLNPQILDVIGYDEICDYIDANQENDGYINSHFQKVEPAFKWMDFASGHEIYTAGHLIQAGVAESRILGKKKLYGSAIKFADLLVKKFGNDQPYISDGHPLIETALIELYRESGDVSYLRLSDKMLEGRGHETIASSNAANHFHPTPAKYIQDHVPVRETNQAVGHAVRQMYLGLGVMDLFIETKDLALLAVQETLWEDVTSAKMYLTGGIGSRHRDESFGDPYELPNDRAYAETCASVGLFMWSWKLLLATGKSRYADLLETLIHNILPGAISSDYQNFFYSNPLHRRADHMMTFDEEASSRLPWYRVSCCPANLARLVGSLNTYLLSENSQGIYVHLYSSGRFSSAMSELPFQIHLNSKYATAGNVQLQIHQISGQAIYLRNPKWSKNTIIKINGDTVVIKPNKEGYFALEGCKDKDIIEIDFGIKAEFVFPHPLIDGSRGCLAIVRGPTIYVLEQSPKNGGMKVEDFVLESQSPLLESEAEDANGRSFIEITVKGFLPEVEESPYQTSVKPLKGQSVKAVLVPYSLWGNPVLGGMRVWIPATSYIYQ